MSDYKGCYSNEEGLATGGEGREGEKVNLEICPTRELNPGLQHERREHRPPYQGGLLRIVEIFHCKYYVAVFLQFSPLKDP